MRKEMNQLAVVIEGGEVFISQGAGMDEDDVIRVTPEQIPLLIQWLQEAASEFGRGE